jgi:hypothetical protein
MSITTTHVANFKLRVRLLLFSLFFGAVLGGWLGHNYIREEMNPQVLNAFNGYWPARLMEVSTLSLILHPQQDDPGSRYLYRLRHFDNGTWAEYFENRAKVAYVYFPASGSIICAVLLMWVGSRIGRVKSGE